jgi:dienelactone hydrolase
MEQIAEKGYDTFIAKMPLNIAFLNENAANAIISAYPNIHEWTIGGHSLGGVAACDYAAAHKNIKGVLLYAAYPSKDISHDTGQDFTSIYGTQDGLATPAKVNANKKLLPPTTIYLPIQGGIHSYFGNYGHQDGDGQATVSRQQAQSEIVADSVSFLQHVAVVN